MSPMNNRLLVPRKVPGLLDLVPGAAAAYSLRSLSNSYADPVVTVRRSSDDAEEDFTAAEVADGTLAAFCGAGDGFVKQWWDQSGSANHAVAAADTNEPKIVDGGVVVTEEGKPALQFDGIDDSLDANALAATFSGIDVVMTTAMVCKTDSSVASNLVAFGFGNSTTNNPVRWLGQNATLAIIAERDDTTPSDGRVTGGSVSSQGMVFTVSNVDQQAMHVNGASYGTSSSSFGQTTLNQFSIGCLPRITKIVFWDGNIQELIIYPSDLTAQRELVEGLIAWGYSV